jgi:transcriptional regulator GlxA family with amidase domain
VTASDTGGPVVVGLLTFDGCDLIDLVNPYEVFLTANRLRDRAGAQPPFDPLVIGPEVVRGYGGMRLLPDVRVADAPRLDLLIVPGAIDVDAARPDDDVVALADRAAVLAPVCTGAFFLQRTGLLGDRPTTTHWEDADALRALGAEVRDDVRWVDAGAVVSGGGLSSGIAMALHLVERYTDRALAEACARQIDYVWTEGR